MTRMTDEVLGKMRDRKTGVFEVKMSENSRQRRHA